MTLHRCVRPKAAPTRPARRSAADPVLVEEGRQTVDEALADRFHSKFVRRRAAGHEPRQAGVRTRPVNSPADGDGVTSLPPLDVFSVSRTPQTTRDDDLDPVFCAPHDRTGMS